MQVRVWMWVLWRVGATLTLCGVSASSLLHKGASWKQRTPSFFLYPGSTRLHVRSSDSVGGWNYGKDPLQHLPIGKWTHVAMQHKMKQFRVFLNGDLIVRSIKANPPLSTSGKSLAAQYGTCGTGLTLCVQELSTRVIAGPPRAEPSWLTFASSGAIASRTLTPSSNWLDLTPTEPW